MHDAHLNYIRGSFMMHARTGAPPKRNGAKSAFGGPPPADIYPCKPGGPNDWVYVFNSHNNPEHWRRLAKTIGRPELADDPEYVNHANRMKHASEVDGFVFAHAADDRELWPALKRFFVKDDVEAAIR